MTVFNYMRYKIWVVYEWQNHINAFILCLLQRKNQRHKPEGCGFESRWCHWHNLPPTQPRTEMKTRNIFWWGGGKSGRCMGLTNLPHSYADRLDIWSLSLLESYWACNMPEEGLLFLYIFLNPLNAELNPICYLLALLAHHFLHVSRISVKSLTLRLLMSYIHGAPIVDVSRSHTTTHHSR